MTWTDGAIAALARGERVTIRPRGNSMTPRILSGQEVTLEPCTATEAHVHDAVLTRVGGKVYLHLVLAKNGDRVLIGNNHGHQNGWTSTVYGRQVR